MDTEVPREALVTPEPFASDVDAALPPGPAHPLGRRANRSGRFAVIAVAVAVVLIVATVSVIRSHSPRVTGLPAPASRSALSSKLDGTSWLIGTVAKGVQGKPISATFQDSFSISFSPDDTVSLYSPVCKAQTASWNATDLTVTIGKLAPQVNSCLEQTGTPSAASAPLTAAYHAMTVGPTTGRLDGRSLVVQAGAYVLVFRSGGTQPAVLTNRTQPSVDTAARLWAHFPIAARPRPVVLMTAAVVLPFDPLPDGEHENALAAGRLTLATTAPSVPDTVRGYPIISAQAAIAQLTDPQQAAADRSSLHIVKLQLVDQSFRTDRGDTPLPTWKVVLAESPDPIYVLAVAAAGRYPATLANDQGIGESASLTGNGRDITIAFTAHHVSEGGCDRDRTATLATKETSTAVVVAVTVRLDPAVPRPGCTAGFAILTSLYPAPGQDDTKTVHLQEPLGNRVVVDQLGIPYVVVTS